VVRAPGQRQPHLGVEKPFEPSRNAHLAFFASSLHGSVATMDAAGSPVRVTTHSRRGAGSTGKPLLQQVGIPGVVAAGAEI
jgi:hypothetical protein